MSGAEKRGISRRRAVLMIPLALAAATITGRVWHGWYQNQRADEFREKLRLLAVEPDWQSQNCLSTRELATGGIWRDFTGFTAKSYTWVREERDLAVAEIESRMDELLPGMILLFRSGESWDDSVYEFVSYLYFIVDLNAVELLPRLLEYERVMRPFTVLEDESLGKEVRREEEYRDRLYNPEVYSRMFSAILMILQQERMEPVLSSPMIAEGRLDLTTQKRDQIIEWAETYLAETPPSERLCAKGMLPEPVNR